MKSYFALLMVLFSLLVSCRQGRMKNPVPEDVIPVDTMMMVMEKMMVMENAVRNDYPQLVRNKEIVLNSGDSIFKEYHLSFDRYNRSLDYYLFSQDTMKYIYNHISDHLTQEMNEISK